MSEPIETLSTHVLRQDKFVTINVDDVRFPGGHEGTYTTMSTGNGTGVIAVVTDGESVALVRQYRYPLREHMWELVRGMGEPGSDAENCAREVVEETGLNVDASMCELLGTISPDSGTLGTRVAVFLVKVEKKELIPEEGMDVRWVKLSELNEFLKDTAWIIDSMTLAALRLANL